MTIKEMNEIMQILKDMADIKRHEIDELMELKDDETVNQDALHRDIAEIKRYLMKVNNGIRNIENFVID